MQNTWYKKGLNFKCQKCARCCSWPGHVWLAEKDITKISSFLNLTEEDFLKKYTRSTYSRIALKEFANYDCIFLKEKKCLIYSVRPLQCKTFPIWPKNLTSKDKWQALEKDCPGIAKDAPLISFEEIKKILKMQIK